MHRITLRAGLVGTAALGSLALGAAAYAAVGLPGAASDQARVATTAAGVTIPGPNEHAGEHPQTRGSSVEDPVEDPTDDPTEATDDQQDATDPATDPSDESGSHGKGSEVSRLATTTELKGVEKGAAISALASGGKSQAGQHGKGDHPTPQGPKDHPHGKPGGTGDVGSPAAPTDRSPSHPGH